MEKIRCEELPKHSVVGYTGAWIRVSLMSSAAGLDGRGAPWKINL